MGGSAALSGISRVLGTLRPPLVSNSSPPVSASQVELGSPKGVDKTLTPWYLVIFANRVFADATRLR